MDPFVVGRYWVTIIFCRERYSLIADHGAKDVHRDALKEIFAASCIMLLCTAFHQGIKLDKIS